MTGSIFGSMTVHTVIQCNQVSWADIEHIEHAVVISNRCFSSNHPNIKIIAVTWWLYISTFLASGPPFVG